MCSDTEHHRHEGGAPVHTEMKLHFTSHVLIPYHSSRVLRSSSSSNILQVSRTNLIVGSRSFLAAASTIWNSLPDSLRSSDTFNVFSGTLKHTFSEQLLTPLVANFSTSDSAATHDSFM